MCWRRRNAPAVIAVDMPIGLPERAGHGGRAAENAVRPLLGARQSSVFSVPARAAIDERDYAGACRVGAGDVRAAAQGVEAIVQHRAQDPRGGRGPARRHRPAARVYEVHPELAFWRLNGERALDEPKKVKSRPYPPGLALRRKLLLAAALPPALVAATPPKGAAEDDVIDALACAAIARRLHVGSARPFPDPPPRDAFGLPMAIWA